MITLTGLQIKELAEFVGFSVNADGLTDELETPITITKCPPEGIRNDGEPSDPGAVSHYEFIAYCSEYPEEGCIGLGPETSPPPASQSACPCTKRDAWRCAADRRLTDCITCKCECHRASQSAPSAGSGELPEFKLRCLKGGGWIVRIGDGQIPELFPTPHAALNAALAYYGLATAGQVPDWDMAQHWIDRYASGIDDELQLDRVADALGLEDPTT